MTGPVEEAGSTARGFIEALKGQPAVLALSVANFALIAFIFYALSAAGKFRETLMNQVFANTAQIHEILKQRSVPCPDVRTEYGPFKPAEITVEPSTPVEPSDADHSH